jgi:hypothetical protein
LKDLRDAVIDANENLKAAKNNPTIPKEYHATAEKLLREAQSRYFDALSKVGQRILNDLEAGKEKKPPPQCPPRTQTMLPSPPSSNIFVTLGVTGSSGEVALGERDAATGRETAQFNQTGSAVGGVAEIGFRIAVAHQLFVGAVAAINVRQLVQRQTFAHGLYLGSTIDWSGSALASATMGSPSGVLISALAGPSVARETIDIFLGGPATSSSRYVAGLTVGIEGEVALPQLSRALGTRMAVVARFTQTWWDRSEEYRPASSPAFNYDALARESMLSLALRGYLN